MNDFSIPLKSKDEICENTIAFTFDLSGIDYPFEAGQYAYFTIPDPVSPDKKGHTRPLSIANSPNRKDILMVVARKNSSVFIENLSKVKPGTKILVSKPEGNLKIEKENTDKVFIAGGTGIAPVRSIIEQQIEEGLSCKIYLFYINKKKSQTVFFDEFKKWEASHEKMQFIPIIDGTEHNKINARLLKECLSDYSNKLYYITGPDGMVESVKKILLESGVKSNCIKTEKM